MKGRTVFGILLPAAGIAGLIAFGWALCKAAGDADRAADAQYAAHRERARRTIDLVDARAAHPTNVVRLPVRRPYDWATDDLTPSAN